MTPSDFMNVCRLCLVKEKVSVPIFEGEGGDREIFMKISTCLPVKVEKNDLLPKKICDVCLYNVENVFKFWHTTANSEKKLLQWLEATEKGEISADDNFLLESEQVILKEETIEPEEVFDHSKNQKNNDSQDGMGRSDIEDNISDENCFNSGEDTAVDKNIRVKDNNDSDDDYAELEPTTFVNVSMSCEDQPGPSGLQSDAESAQNLGDVDSDASHTANVQSGKPALSEPEVVPSTSKIAPDSSGTGMRSTVKLSSQELLERKRARERQRYWRMKQDPLQCQLMKAKERQKYANKKMRKKVCSVVSMTETDALVKRKQWRENSKSYYWRKKSLGGTVTEGQYPANFGHYPAFHDPLYISSEAGQVPYAEETMPHPLLPNIMYPSIHVEEGADEESDIEKFDEGMEDDIA